MQVEAQQGMHLQIPFMPPTLKMFFLSGFGESMCCSFQSYDKYLDVQMQELPTEDLCKTSQPAEKEASQAIVLNTFEPLVVFEQVYRTCLRTTLLAFASPLLLTHVSFAAQGLTKTQANFLRTFTSQFDFQHVVGTPVE